MRYGHSLAKQTNFIRLLLFPELRGFSPRVQFNLQTMLCLLSDPHKVFILIIPLTFRPSKGRGRPFLWAVKSYQVSKILICTLFQSRPSSYQGNVVRLLRVKSNQKVTSGKPSKFPVHSYHLGDLIFMLRSDYYQIALGLLILV